MTTCPRRDAAPISQPARKQLFAWSVPLLFKIGFQGCQGLKQPTGQIKVPSVSSYA